MIRFNKKVKISLANTKVQKSKNVAQEQPQLSSTFRPQVCDAKVYKVKSAFVKNSVFITLSYIDTEYGRKPIEIFINSKDLNRAPEYVVLTRLISAIFRRATDPMFILEELHGIHDPNGGSFKEGKYYHSFYAEVAEAIERFFYDVGIIEKENIEEVIKNKSVEKTEPISLTPPAVPQAINIRYKICPTCNERALKTENGCDSCIECGYSKCDK